MNFNGKTALVIGGTSGIGAALVTKLSNDGAKIHVVGRSTDKLEDHENITKHKVDITKDSDVETLINSINELENLDFLVNSSGIFGPKSFLEHTKEDYDSYLNLNRGFFFITQAAAKKMKETYFRNSNHRIDSPN